MNSFRLDYDPVNLAQHGIRSLYDASILLIALRSGEDGVTIPQLTETMRCCTYHCVTEGLKRMVALNMLVPVGRQPHKPSAMIYRATIKALNVIRGEASPDASRK